MSNLDSMDKTIAKSEIYDLSCKYMRGLDRLDLELLKSVFHEGAWCDYGFTKSDAPTFAQFCMDALKEHHANHHMIGNALIEFGDNENEAFGEVYFRHIIKLMRRALRMMSLFQGVILIAMKKEMAFGRWFIDQKL